jgi:hypothetical protein
MQPTTRYTKSGDVHIAYQVFGNGPLDLVFTPGFLSHLENQWDQPDLSRWLLRLARFARVVMFDKRGTGLSDRAGELPNFDQRMDDLRAVMDAVGIERAALLGVSEGGPPGSRRPKSSRPCSITSTKTGEAGPPRDGLRRRGRTTRPSRHGWVGSSGWVLARPPPWP